MWSAILFFSRREVEGMNEFARFSDEGQSFLGEAAFNSIYSL
jgi:hypothetical protein